MLAIHPDSLPATPFFNIDGLAPLVRGPHIGRANLVEVQPGVRRATRQCVRGPRDAPHHINDPRGRFLDVKRLSESIKPQGIARFRYKDRLTSSLPEQLGLPA